MGYSYSPQSKDERARAFFDRRGKQLAVAAVIVFLVGAFYTTGNLITSYATYNKDLQEQLNSTQAALETEQQQKESCQALLESSNSDLNKCGNDLASTKGYLASCGADKDKLNSNIQNLSASLDTCKSEKESINQSYKQLARNSVKAICCSFGDVQSAAIRNWNIINNSISCTGNYTVNCTDGETNY